VDSFPPNVERIAAAPFSLDAARRRHPLESAPALAPDVPDSQRLPRLTEQAARQRPRLELVAGSFVPEPTPAQITDARDRFLGRVTRDLASASGPLPPPTTAGQPSMALLQRIPLLLPWHDDGRPGA
jgi:hypothetical protein